MENITFSIIFPSFGLKSFWRKLQMHMAGLNILEKEVLKIVHESWASKEGFSGVKFVVIRHFVSLIWRLRNFIFWVQIPG